MSAINSSINQESSHPQGWPRLRVKFLGRFDWSSLPSPAEETWDLQMKISEVLSKSVTSAWSVDPNWVLCVPLRYRRIDSMIFKKIFILKIFTKSQPDSSRLVWNSLLWEPKNCINNSESANNHGSLCLKKHVRVVHYAVCHPYCNWDKYEMFIERVSKSFQGTNKNWTHGYLA